MQNTWKGKFLEIKPERYFEVNHPASAKPSPHQFIPDKVINSVTFAVEIDGVKQILTSFPRF